MIALGAPGPFEITLIVLVILLLFGAKRLPELAKGLGKGIREFRSAVTDTSDQIKKGMEGDQDSKANMKTADNNEFKQKDESSGKNSDQTS